MEFSMYTRRYVSAGSVVACSACDVLRLDASPFFLGVTSCPPPTWRYGPRKSML